MQKWEYLRLDVRYKDPKDPGVQSVLANYEEILSDLNLPDYQSYLNQLGAQGWEMVSERSATERQQVFYFKRPLKNKVDKKSKKKKSAI